MDQKQLANQILADVKLLAERTHPGDQELQRLYMIGYLAGSLAGAMYYDSHVYTRFNKQIDENLLNAKPRSSLSKQNNSNNNS